MKIDDVFRKLRPVMGPKLDLLWQEYVVSDTSVRREIERVLRIELAQRLDETFESSQLLLKPPPAPLAAGDYPAGEVYYAQELQYPFGIREEEFIQHIGIFGRSGSGKTNLAYLLVLDLIGAGKPFLVFDWKRNYRDLLSLPECRDLVILTVGRNVAPFQFNPLVPPPGTQPTVWLKKLIEVMCHAYFLGEGVTVLLMRAIDSLYQRFGVYDGAPVRMPTLADVRNFLLERKTKGREAGWMESAMRAVEVLCFGEMGRVLNSEAPFDIADLLNRHVVLELDALTNADKTFLIESLLLWIHHYRMGQPDREEFNHGRRDRHRRHPEGDPRTRRGDHLPGPASQPDLQARPGQHLHHLCLQPQTSRRPGHDAGLPAAGQRADRLPGPARGGLGGRQTPGPLVLAVPGQVAPRQNRQGARQRPDGKGTSESVADSLPFGTITSRDTFRSDSGVCGGFQARHHAREDEDYYSEKGKRR